MMIVVIIGISTFFFFRGHSMAAPSDQTEEPQQNPVIRSIVFLVLGAMALGAGLVGYFIVILTGCLTFNYNRPVWNSVKAKKYLVNIVVIVGLSLGLGFMLSAVIGPVLAGLGMPPTQANLLPVLAVLIGFQLMQLWVLIWSPLEKRTIVKRLGAMGITPEQLQDATLVGLSNPASGTVKRFAAIEEDVGALWVTPDRLAYRGDTEQFDLAREHIVDIERRADNRSTSVLAGIAHPILHVRLADGTVRQIRLHVEGFWTLGQKRHAMDGLAYTIQNWYEGKVYA
jgi:hypothetical protein